MSRRAIRGARAIVTGASSGIGRALARQLSSQGAALVLTARREDRLRELAGELCDSGGEVVIVPGDITDSDVRAAVLRAADSHWSALDLLVNNAGVGATGPFAAASEERLRRVMEVNFFAPAELTRLAMPLLHVGRRPLVVNIGSVLGHRAVPNKSEYCASKFALHGWSDALRAEWVREGIELLLVSPSTTESEFFERLLERRGSGARRRRAMPAESVARLAIRAMRQGRHEVILSPGGKLLVWLDRLAPPLVNRLLARWG